MNIVIGSDHAAFNQKEELKKWLTSQGHELMDVGTSSQESCDYPYYAKELAKIVVMKQYIGILLCGSGIGVSMVANKFKGVRAALCRSIEDARLSREHNNSNVICLGSRITSLDSMKEIILAWQHTEFIGGRHDVRVKQLNEMGEHF